MSYLGKILAFTNILGIALLMVLALMVYTKHTAWRYANYRYQTAIDGLPLHKEQKDAQGYPLYVNVDPAMQQELFPTDPVRKELYPVTTQKDEVERVQKALQAKLDAETDKAKQSALVATFLLPLSQTNGQRERLLSVRRHLADDKTVEQLKKDLQTAYAGAIADHKADPKKEIAWAFADRLTILGGEPRRPFEEKLLDIKKKKDPDKAVEDADFTETLDAINADLKEQFDRAFKQVLDGQYFFAKPMTDDERKDAISDLLFNMVEAEIGEAAVDRNTPLYQNPAYLRYLNVVGLEAANRTISNQTVRLSRILSELAYEQTRDQTGFVIALQAILDQSKDVARAVERLTADLKVEQDKVNRQRVQVKAREEDVKNAKIELADNRKTTAEKLVKLRDMSKAVFELRVAVRDKTVTNQKYEREIRELEGWRWLPFVGGKYLINREEP